MNLKGTYIALFIFLLLDISVFGQTMEQLQLGVELEEEFKEAYNNNDSIYLSNVLTESSVDYFNKMRYKAIYATKADLLNSSIFEKYFILVVRMEYTLVELKKFKGRGFARTTFERLTISKPGSDLRKCYDFEMSDWKFGNMTCSNQSGTRGKIYFEWDAGWKWNILKIYESEEKSLEQLETYATNNNIDINSLIISELKKQYPTVTNDIWKPLDSN